MKVLIAPLLLSSLLDWKMIVITMLNFVIVLVIIRFLLLKPVLKVMDQRKLMVESELKEAEVKNQEASKLKASLKEAEQKLAAKVDLVLEDAIKSGKEKEDQIIKEARLRAKALVQKAHEDIRLERARNIKSHQRDIADLALVLASSILEKEIKEEDHQALVNSFIQDLGAK